jgi:hypothetical protein
MSELTPEQIRQVELSEEIMNEIIQEIGIEGIENLHKSETSGLENRIFKIEDNRGLVIYAEVDTLFGQVRIEFPLIAIVFQIVNFLEKLFSRERMSEALHPEVVWQLKSKGIDILTLLNMEEAEVPEKIKTFTKSILTLFFHNIPIFTEASVLDASTNSIFGYFQHVVRGSLREHWEELGLGKDFNLITASELEQAQKFYLDRRRWFLGDRKQLLTEENFRQLADQSESLRKHYKELKYKYKELKRSYKSLNGGSEEGWVDKCEELRQDKFPELLVGNTQEFETLAPFELANKHLALMYGYDEEVMRKKITQSRKSRKKT